MQRERRTPRKDLEVRLRFFACRRCNEKHVAIDFEALEGSACMNCGLEFERLNREKQVTSDITWPAIGDIWVNKRLSTKARIHQVDWNNKQVTITDGRNYRKVPVRHFARPEEGWKLFKKFTP